jgi:secondary thiamine-phosphate synthase enzyme
MDTFTLRTNQRNEMLDITEQIRTALRQRGLKNGCAIVYCPHTTGAITINEAYDPDVVHDMLLWLGRTVPKDQAGFRHDEGNSDSHIKASLIGASATVLVSEGELVLGRWQGVFFCELDGPRTRTVHVQFLGDG